MKVCLDDGKTQNALSVTIVFKNGKKLIIEPSMAYAIVDGKDLARHIDAVFKVFEE